MLDLKAKIEHSRTRLSAEEANAEFVVRVDRQTLIKDSYEAIIGAHSTWELKQRLKIEFVGEKGKDYGGMSREWFLQLTEKLLAKDMGLFVRPCDERYEYHINPFSGTSFVSESPEKTHLDYFFFVGRILAMAFYHGKLVEMPMVAPFWKMLQLGEDFSKSSSGIVSLEDVRKIDPVYWKSLDWMLENDVNELDMDFSITLESPSGEMKLVNLKTDDTGEVVKISNENKREYVEMAIQHKMYHSVMPQMQAIVTGFYEFIERPKILDPFQTCELPIVFNGSPEVDVEDWRLNTHYDEGLSEWSEVVGFFWEVVDGWDNEKRSLLLQFATGSKKVPVGGFANLYGSNGTEIFPLFFFGFVIPQMLNFSDM